MRPPYPFKLGDNKTGQCSACGEVFYGEESFDKHRQGEEPNRVCVDPARQKPSKGGRRYWYDNQGRWHYGAPINPNEYAERQRASGARLRTGQENPEGGSSAEKTPSQVSQVPPTKSEPSTGHTAGAAIVIRTIEGRTPTPPMTPERYAEQVATLARAGIRVPPGVMP